MKTYYKQLDGLRAVAVTTVMIGHFCPYPMISKLVGYGDTGVVIFFCLSGFLITGILLDIKELPQSRLSLLGTFYARRALRIFPIYYLVIAVAVALGSASVIASLPRLLTYTANYVPGLPIITNLGPFPHLWSLSVEEQFYLVWPVLIFLMPRKFMPASLLVVICSSVAFKAYGVVSGASYTVIYKSVFSCMDSLASGSALALARPQLPYLFARVGNRIVFLSIALVGLITVIRFWVDADAWYRGHEILGVIYFQSIILLSCSAIAASVSGERWLFSSFLEAPPLVSTGRISYGLYVYHFCMPYVAAVIVPHIYSRFPASATVAVSFATAALSWFAIERPLLSLKPSFSHQQRATEEPLVATAAVDLDQLPRRISAGISD